MSLINVLLTGGILVGKVCQALAGGLGTRTFFHEESGVTYTGEVDSGGVTFFRQEQDGVSEICAFNTSVKEWAVVGLPNLGPRDGLHYLIPPRETLTIAEFQSPNVPPTTEVLTGPTGPFVDGAGGGESSRVKLSFGDLRIPGIVRIGSFRLGCTTGQLVVLSGALTVTAITYMCLNSDKGVKATTQQRILPTDPPADSEADEKERRFDVDFASLGFDLTEDTLNGDLTLEIAASADELAALSAAPSRPLNDGERAFFEQGA